MLLRYYQALARASDRVNYREIGKTTLGQPFVVLYISSPSNLRQLAGFRAINAKMADPRTIRSAAEASGLLKDGRAVVLITSSIHSTEVGGHLTPAILAHRLATDTSAATRAILDDVILLLVPSLRDEILTITNHTGHPSLTLPAGFVEAGETPAVAARRELHEETGYDGAAFEPLGAYFVFPSLSGARLRRNPELHFCSLRARRAECAAKRNRII